MKAICPISGVPFRTYDSLPIHLPVNHPIFSLDFSSLIDLLDYVREQELSELHRLHKDSDLEQTDINGADFMKQLTSEALEAIHEKNWKNPSFKLYQTKHLVLLALMKQADLLEQEKGYCARPKPVIIEAYFWQGVELFSWASTVSLPVIRNQLPHYKISKYNETMVNLPDYLEILANVKTSIGNKFRALSDERKLETMEKAIAILAKHRDRMKKDIADGGNNIAAKWALMITNCPKEMYDFWYAILRSNSMKITFEGVKIDDKWESVNASDLRELRDWLEDNLLQPAGDKNEYHRDDSEYYFIARSTVLSIVRRHLDILEQGTASFRVTNVALGDDILNASDDLLAMKAKDANLLGDNPEPEFQNYETRVKFIIAMAAWRHKIKTALLEMSTPASKQDRDDGAQYEIL